MISFVRGELEEFGENYVVLDVGGVGYRVFTTTSLFADHYNQYSAGEVMKLYTHLSVKEDDMSLFGFLTRQERDLFRLLLTVNGIGPKGAMGILSVLSPEQLSFAVLTDDAKAISKAPGIGLKTAQKLVLELKDKFKADDLLEAAGGNEGLSEAAFGSGSPIGGSGAAADSGAFAETVLALVALGYGKPESQRAVRKAMNELGADAGSSKLLSAALKNMM